MSKYAPGFQIRIPNNEEGQIALGLIKKGLNRDRYKLRLRANGPRTKHAVANGLHPRAYDQDLPMEYAESIRVYIENK